MPMSGIPIGGIRNRCFTGKSQRVRQTRFSVATAARKHDPMNACFLFSGLTLMPHLMPQTLKKRLQLLCGSGNFVSLFWEDSDGLCGRVPQMAKSRVVFCKGYRLSRSWGAPVSLRFWRRSLSVILSYEIVHVCECWKPPM